MKSSYTFQDKYHIIRLMTKQNLHEANTIRALKVIMRQVRGFTRKKYDY